MMNEGVLMVYGSRINLSLMLLFVLLGYTSNTLTTGPVTKVIIPAAGLGTRFLPYSKSVPKEMVTVVDRPAIQHVIEEVLQAGVNEFLIVTSGLKNTIQDYFAPVTEFTKQLEQRNKLHLIKSVADIIARAHFTYITQAEQLGLGHAILQAKGSIHDEYFGVILPDDLILGEEPELKHLIDLAQKHQGFIIGVNEVPDEEISSYWIIDIKAEIAPGVFEVKDLVEKPRPEDAPSHLAIGGRYILNDAIFKALEVVPPSKNGELQLTDAIAHVIRNNPDIKVYAYKFKGKRYDIGTPPGLIKAVIALGLQNPAYREQIKGFLAESFPSHDAGIGFMVKS